MAIIKHITETTSIAVDDRGCWVCTKYGTWKVNKRNEWLSLWIVTNGLGLFDPWGTCYTDILVSRLLGIDEHAAKKVVNGELSQEEFEMEIALAAMQES